METMYLAAISGKPKEILDEWRQELSDADKVWRAFSRSIGAVALFNCGCKRPIAFGFERDAQIPDGWTRPDRRGRSRPYFRNTKMIKKLASLPWPEEIGLLLSREFHLPTDLTYWVGGDSSRKGYMVVAPGDMPFRSYTPCWWKDGPIILRTGNFPKETERLKAEGHKVFLSEGDGTIPEGFAIMTQAKVEFGFAKAKLDAEGASA